MAFADDFFGALRNTVTNSINRRSAATGTNSNNSLGSVAADGFYTLTRDYVKGKNVKQQIIDRVAATKTVQNYASQQREMEINKFIMNPALWIGGLLVVLIIGYMGYAWGKR